MRRMSFSVMLISAAILLGMVASTEVSAEQAYFRCKEGFKLEVYEGKNAVRCYEVEEYPNDSGKDAGEYPKCEEPFNWDLARVGLYVDYGQYHSGSPYELYQDVCTGTAKINLSIGETGRSALRIIHWTTTCPSGYSQHFVKGSDRCAKHIAKNSEPPTVQVFLPEPTAKQILFGIIEE